MLDSGNSSGKWQIFGNCFSCLEYRSFNCGVPIFARPRGRKTRSLVCGISLVWKRPHSKRPHPETENDHKTCGYQNRNNQNGHSPFGQNGHISRSLTKWPHYFGQNGHTWNSLPKRPHLSTPVTQQAHDAITSLWRQNDVATPVGNVLVAVLVNGCLLFTISQSIFTHCHSIPVAVLVVLAN